jgi:hypothetical protein
MSSMIIEEESGTVTRTATTTKPRRGYATGTFGATSADDLARWFAWGRAESCKLSGVTTSR